MSPVIKHYTFMPVPITLTNTPIRQGYWKWQNHYPLPIQLSKLLYQWLERRANNRPKWN